MPWTRLAFVIVLVGCTTPPTVVEAGSSDADCDGPDPTGCPCTGDLTNSCYTGPAGSQNLGICHEGLRSCVDGSLSTCVGEVVPRHRTCTDLADTECTGIVQQPACDLPDNVDAGATYCCRLAMDPYTALDGCSPMLDDATWTCEYSGGP